ncbi:MAG: hypothetical protein CVU65_17610 [Deltaproteobacteria bacterium HGW-Deltaproteobacteria-22]|nr:MAG: hypothetical protein CVU65_17610 [Deltaproteobacteria bacterium HGW-Deltaproteobacteria-22]
MTRKAPVHEPHKIKTIRLLNFPTLEERKRHLVDARFNVLNLTQDQLNFDMFSLGTSAVSQEQLSGQLLGDEAYAGAINFERLEAAIKDVFGINYVTPTHNILGSIKLVAATLIPAGSQVPSNGRTRVDTMEPRGVTMPDVRDHAEKVFTGNVDLAKLEGILKEAKNVALVGLQTFADGQHPFSLANIKSARAVIQKYGHKMSLDGSRIVENAWYIQKHEPGQEHRRVAEIVKDIAQCTNIFMMDAAQDAKCNIGGFLAADNPVDYEKFMNEVVLFEGLHTYGGMAGRTMEVFSRGLREMLEEPEVQWLMYQVERFTQKLVDGGVPVERGCDGAYLKVDAFLPKLEKYRHEALSAAIYLACGMRCAATGLVDRDNLLPVQIPRLAVTNEQLDQIAEALIKVHAQRDKIKPLELVRGGRWRDQLEFRGVFPNLETYEFNAMPYLIHTIEKVGGLDREHRERAIKEAGYNTFLLRSPDVSIDLLTDSGTSSMSTDQWAAYDATRATAACSLEYKRLVANLKEFFGYQYILPTHQGRAAEHIMSTVMIKKGQYVPGNMYFTTTKEHQEMAGGIFVDVICDEAHDSTNEFIWKGNVDLKKLDAIVQEHGAGKVAYISYEFSVNLAGGQPCSMDNIKETYAYCSERKIPVMFDATRVVENAFMIQQKDPRYKNIKIRDILREMMAHGDGCTISGKKDFLINIGGLLAYRDNEEWARKSEEMLRYCEGAVTDGGLSIADLAGMARGVEEMLDDRYIHSRVKQTEYLGRLLMAAGVPIVVPPGSHAIFVDAKRFLPHIDQDEFPAQRLAAELYVESGVRAMERGNVSKGRAPDGKNYRPSLELVRLTIPRRVYTNDHMKAIAEGVIALYKRRTEIKGLKFVYEPAHLRFFQSRFAPVE